ncbi:DNA-binding protein [Diaphorobacter sp. LR2014-1]|uniref:DNA-binding protein n=1 Tax=Diaphorobacter sp. LR2014-1 TaxID=1933219 RepID=UPI000CDB6732|nr:DNA-binding protein [Diaphorobacter sp. LR2014-1]POR10801.1 hypothetical protein BV908_08695 [Diaphorobacter sp. LR2014-1]
MRPTEFTKDEIINAGKQLQAAARGVTGFALRQLIGGGNPTRLKQVWDDYISTTQGEAVNILATDLPSDVAEELEKAKRGMLEHLHTLTLSLNATAIKNAERRAEEADRNAREIRLNADRELNDAATTVNDLEEKLTQSQLAVDKLMDQNQHQLQEIAKLQERIDQMTIAADKARADHSTLAALLDRESAASKAAQERAEKAIAEAAKLQGILQGKGNANDSKGSLVATAASGKVKKQGA